LLEYPQRVSKTKVENSLIWLFRSNLQNKYFHNHLVSFGFKKEHADGKLYVTEVNVRHVAFSVCFAAGGETFAEDKVRLLGNDNTFDRNYRMYDFEEDLIFSRDVDARPLLMKEAHLLQAEWV